MKILLRMYAKLRVFTSPIIWRITNNRKIKGGESKYANFILCMDMDQASDILNAMKYIPDKWKGLLDCSVPVRHAQTFFSPEARTRDCDDYARLWSIWGTEHGYMAREWIVVDVRLRRRHIITTLSKDRRHWLMNYRPYGPTSSLDLALEKMELWYDKPVFAEYDWRRER